MNAKILLYVSEWENWKQDVMEFVNISCSPNSCQLFENAKRKESANGT